MYWQRQGLCCFILVQRSGEGRVPDVIAPMQGFSSVGLHVTAAAAINTSASCANTKTSAAAAASTKMLDAFIFHSLTGINATQEERELGGVYLACVAS
ncbi:hypothetical protein Acr_11g0007290 [Actinidia rufa]|uniref:Uncharacterized protein n=1 Tax=Actinidia rufa TaxID=165716 RepID=A0A7J0FCU3_9ERIC|nr:hypothetical protein Acr_11g0007290 [Actinidia rufa]